MKIKPRATVTTAIARRITSPEAKRDPKTGKKIAMLGFIDASAYQKHIPTTKDLFVFAAGSNVEGEVPDGLDRLTNHQFVIHLNKGGKAIGIDVIPSRLYRSGVVPRSMDGVKTLIVQFELDGAVARVTQRPFNVRFEQSQEIIRQIGIIANAGKAVTAGMRLGNVGRVVNTTENSVEVKLNAANQRNTQQPPRDSFDQDDIEEAPDEPVGESASAEG